MKSYPYSAARGSFATVLVEAERDGAVEIRRRGISNLARINIQGKIQGIAAECEGRQVGSLHCRTGGDCARRTGAGIENRDVRLGRGLRGVPLIARCAMSGSPALVTFHLVSTSQANNLAV